MHGELGGENWLKRSGGEYLGPQKAIRLSHSVLAFLRGKLDFQITSNMLKTRINRTSASEVHPDYNGVDIREGRTYSSSRNIRGNDISLARCSLLAGLHMPFNEFQDCLMRMRQCGTCSYTHNRSYCSLEA